MLNFDSLYFIGALYLAESCHWDEEVAISFGILAH